MEGGLPGMKSIEEKIDLGKVKNLSLINKGSTVYLCE